MSIDTDQLVYSLANIFHATLGVKICDATETMLQKKSFAKISSDDKIFYSKYALRIAQGFTEYFGKIILFELMDEEETDIIYDFKLTNEGNEVSYISVDHRNINIQNIIPDKLMKICGYKKNTKICKEYLAQYKEFNDTSYDKIKSKDKYSELSETKKDNVLLKPLCDLVVDTLSKKRKCAKRLYQHLFGEPERLVIKLHKNRFTIYDFSKEIDDVESFKMKLISNNQISVVFNNGTEFMLTLQTNSSEIKQHLSFKFHVRFTNMDELFSVMSIHIPSK